MYSLLHDIPRFFILFLEELFLIFNQMLSIRAFGRHVMAINRIQYSILHKRRDHAVSESCYKEIILQRNYWKMTNSFVKFHVKTFWTHSMTISFLLFMFHICLYYAVSSIPCSLVITCGERADLLAVLCVMFPCVLATFP